MTIRSPKVARHTAQPNSRELLLIAPILVLLLLLIDLLFYPATLEDAFMIFRYSKHIADGHGFGAWNINGERIESITTFLWMVMLALAKPLHIQVETLAKVVGVVSHVCLSLLYLVFPFVCREKLAPDDTPLGRHRDVFIFASIILAFYLPLSWYASTGMETNCFALLVSLAFLAPMMTERVFLLAGIQVALVVMRPEGLVFALGCALFHSLRLRQAGRSAWPTMLALATGLAGFIGVAVLRYVVSGDVLPNSYYAKAGGAGKMHILFGFRYIFSWASSHQLWCFIIFLTVCFCILSLRDKGVGKNLALLFLLAFCAAYVCYIVKVGGDNYWAFPYWRHVLHLMPFISLLVAVGLVNLLPQSRPLRAALLGVLLGVSAYQLPQKHEGVMLADARQTLNNYPTLAHAPHNEYYLWLAELADTNTVIASGLGGELPFVVDAIHIDVLGLNDRWIAHHGRFDPDGPVDSKTDMDWTLKQRPDIIEGYVSGKKIIAGRARQEIVTSRKQMTNALLNNPIFQRDYVFVVNAPYDHLDRAVFMRTEYWLSHPLRHQLDCVPVLRTSLYRHDAI